ncbi:MAG: hypothetical protein HZA51_18135 [Planctomycetes bacterium]|nr:hypothetical protein [Planctomycetota bacterium]
MKTIHRKPMRFHPRRAMTLLELLLALGLVVLIASMMFLFFNQTIRTREHGRRLMTDGRLARVIASKIADEIRNVGGQLPAVGPGIDGKAHVITLHTLSLPDKEVLHRRGIKDAPVQSQSDVRMVQYYLGYDADVSHDYPDGTQGAAPMGLVRSEVKTLFQTSPNENNEQSMSIDLLAAEIKYIRFRYFDGAEWLERWNLGASPFGAFANTLPQAVEVTVGYDEIPPDEEEEETLDFDDTQLLPAPPEPYNPRTYTETVWLRQADAFLGSRLLRAQNSIGSGDKGGESGSGGGT